MLGSRTVCCHAQATLERLASDPPGLLQKWLQERHKRVRTDRSLLDSRARIIVSADSPIEFVIHAELEPAEDLHTGIEKVSNLLQTGRHKCFIRGRLKSC